MRKADRESQESRFRKGNRLSLEENKKTLFTRTAKTSIYKKIKKRVYEIIGPTSKGDTASTIFDISLCALVVASCVSVIIELFFGMSEGVRHVIEVFEYVTVGIFILEYIVRLWVCDLEYPECKNKLHALWE